MQGHLDEPVTVDDLAARSAMSPRTFARRFLATTGTTPHQWLQRQRVQLAQRLLEVSDLPIEVGGRAQRLLHGRQPAQALQPDRAAPAPRPTGVRSRTVGLHAEAAARIGRESPGNRQFGPLGLAR